MPSDDEQKSTESKVQPAGYGFGHLPSYTKQKFLSVHVPKGSSISQIAAAVERALHSPDVPFFKDRTTSSAPPTPPAPPAPPGAQPQVTENLAMAAGAASPADDGDGLLILVQQEGRP